MTQPDPAFEALLEHLKTSRGFDFTGYKRSSLMRRVDRRMAQVGVATTPTTSTTSSCTATSSRRCSTPS